MKKSNADMALAEAMGIEPITDSDQPIVKAPKPLISRPIESGNRINDDAEYARTNIYDIIEKGVRSIEDAMDIARESQHPRAYEVLAQLLKVQSDNVDKLLKVHSDKQKLVGNVENVNPTGNVTIEKAVFVGTTDQLLDMIRRTDKDIIDAEIENDD